MDILDKINKLRTEFGWSVYKLAEETGITQSTLSNMFTRHSTPSLTTLSQICQAFNITLSEFFNENNSDYSEEEKTLIYKYRKLNKRDKKIVVKLIDTINDN